MGPAVFLASPASAYISGEMLVVDGVSPNILFFQKASSLIIRVLWQRGLSRFAVLEFPHEVMHTNRHCFNDLLRAKGLRVIEHSYIGP